MAGAWFDFDYIFMPLLAALAAEGVDSFLLRFLTASALAARRKEEEEKEVAKREAGHQETQQRAADAVERARLLLERNKRKGKKKRKRKLPRASSFACALVRQRLHVHTSVLEAHGQLPALSTCTWTSDQRSVLLLSLRGVCVA